MFSDAQHARTAFEPSPVPGSIFSYRLFEGSGAERPGFELVGLKKELGYSPAPTSPANCGEP
jgi:hypothetical protein